MCTADLNHVLDLFVKLVFARVIEEEQVRLYDLNGDQAALTETCPVYLGLLEAGKCLLAAGKLNKIHITFAFQNISE